MAFKLFETRTKEREVEKWMMEDYKIFKDGRDIYITMGEEC